MPAPIQTSLESTLQAIRQKFATDPQLLAMQVANLVFAKEAPTNTDGSTAVTPPYVVINWAKGKPEWNTGGKASVLDMVNITYYCNDDTTAYLALRKLINAFDGQSLNDQAFSAMSLMNADVGKDTPLVWYALIDLEITTTESNNTN